MHFPFWAAVLVGAAASLVFGVLIGAPTLRLRGDYLAIVTLGFGEIFRITANNLDGTSGPDLTNGSNGVSSIPNLDVLGFDFGAQHDLGGFTIGRFANYFFLMLIITAVVVLVFRRSGNSRIGRAWVAIREDETAALAMGINGFRVKLIAFAVGASLAGLAGTVQAHVTYTVTPEQYLFAGPIPPNSAFLLAAVVLGGMGTISGPLIGAALLFLIPNKLQFLGNYQLFAFGLALILLMRFRPEGLIPNRRRQLEFHEEAEAPTLLTKAGPDHHDHRHHHEGRHPGAAAPGETVLDARGVTMRFGGLTAVRGVDLTVGAGEIVGLIGPNGAGKTTFFNCLTGLYVPTEGEVRYKGAVLPPKSFKVTAAGIARTFQNIRLFANTDRPGERARRPAHPHQGGLLVGRPARPRLPQGRERLQGTGHGTAGLRGPGPQGRPPRPQPALRRAAQTGDRARPRQRTGAAAARRADGRHEPAGDPGHRGTRLRHPGHGHRRPRHRARHALHLQPVRPRGRARAGREADRGRQRDRPGRRTCGRRLPRRALRERARRRGGGRGGGRRGARRGHGRGRRRARAETTNDAAPGKENDR